MVSPGIARLKEKTDLISSDGTACTALSLWYVLRVTYGRELKFQAYLDSREIKSFIPMHWVEKKEKGSIRRKRVPVIHNLIFVYTTRSVIDEIKQQTDYGSSVRYMMNRADRKPVVVSEKQMHDFMLVAGTIDAPIVYLNPEDLAYKKGDRVRITTGIWSGVEGMFVRVKGDRRVVVEIQGVMAVATAFVHPSWIEPVKG